MTKLTIVKCDACDKIIKDGELLITLKCEVRGGYAEDVSMCNIYLTNKDGNYRLVNTTEGCADFCCKECFVQYITAGL